MPHCKRVEIMNPQSEPDIKLWIVFGVLLPATGIVAVVAYARATEFDLLLKVGATLMVAGIASTVIGLVAYLRNR